MIYIYTDNKIGKVIFECKATSISEADNIYKKEIGKDPMKQTYVGCQIIKK